MENDKFIEQTYMFVWGENTFDQVINCFRLAGCDIDLNLIEINGVMVNSKHGTGTVYKIAQDAIIIREGLRMPYCGILGVIHYFKQNTQLTFHAELQFKEKENLDQYWLFVFDEGKREYFHAMGLW